MTKTHAFNPTISEILDAFFASYKPTAGKVVRARIELARLHLARQIETEGPRELTTPQLAIVETERQFSPSDAVARTMRGPELYYVLGTYLRPEYAMDGLLQRETQLDLIAAIHGWLWQYRLIGGAQLDECAVIEYDIWMRRARDEVRKARREGSGAKF